MRERERARERSVYVYDSLNLLRSQYWQVVDVYSISEGITIPTDPLYDVVTDLACASSEDAGIAVCAGGLCDFYLSLSLSLFVPCKSNRFYRHISRQIISRKSAGFSNQVTIYSCDTVCERLERREMNPARGYHAALLGVPTDNLFTLVAGQYEHTQTYAHTHTDL